MLPLLRAFAWLRWRTLMNALERTGSRDRIEVFSRAIEQVGPIVMGLLIVPGALAFGGLGLVAGHAVARDGTFLSTFPLAARFILLVLFATAVLGPLLLPSARQPRNLVRLLLLPIPRGVLFFVESASGATDPWIVVMAPPLVTFPVGLLWGGRVYSATTALVAGAVFFALVVGLAFLATSLFQLVMRDRRRGELLAVVLVFLPLLFSLRQVVAEGRRPRDARPAVVETNARSWVEAPPASGRLKLLPTELYLATMITPGGNRLRALGALAGLLAFAVLVQGASWAVYQRLLAGPSGSHARVARGRGAPWGRLPGLSLGASAVARAQLRLHTRTPRGRIALVMPLLVTGVFAMPTLLGRAGSPLHLSGAPPSAVLGLLAAAISLLAVGPIALNQFSSAGGGLTLEMLSPLADRDLIVGKAAGLTAATMAPVLACQLLLIALFPGTPPGLALAPPLAALAACLVSAPVWAVLSAVFPRTADLNSISRSGNPHGVATLLGTLAVVVALAPAAGLGVAATWGLGRPNLAAPLVLAWCGIAWLAGRALVPPAVATWRARRENIALVAMGR